jgi:hypothetical protein
MVAAMSSNFMSPVYFNSYPCSLGSLGVWGLCSCLTHYLTYCDPVWSEGGQGYKALCVP